VILDAEIRDAALTPFLGEARAAPMYPQRIGSFPAAPSATASDLTGTDG
jgi:hypothetical protein